MAKHYRRGLDEEEREARVEKVEDRVPAADVVRYLSDPGGTWAAADGGQGRTMLAEALFERIEVRGFREVLLNSSAWARTQRYAGEDIYDARCGVYDHSYLRTQFGAPLRQLGYG